MPMVTLLLIPRLNPRDCVEHGGVGSGLLLRCLVVNNSVLSLCREGHCCGLFEYSCVHASLRFIRP